MSCPRCTTQDHKLSDLCIYLFKSLNSLFKKAKLVFSCFWCTVLLGIKCDFIFAISHCSLLLKYLFHLSYSPASPGLSGSAGEHVSCHGLKTPNQSISYDQVVKVPVVVTYWKMWNVSSALTQSSPEGAVGSSGTAPRNQWVTNPEVQPWILSASREALGTIFTLLGPTWVGIEPTTCHS